MRRRASRRRPMCYHGLCAMSWRSAPNPGESAANPPVFNGIAFCYEWDDGRASKRVRRARRRGRPARGAAGLFWVSGAGETVLIRQAEREELLVASPKGGNPGLGMQWLNSFPLADNRVLQIGFLAACGIAALIVLAILYRLAFARRLRVPGGRTRQPRLGLVDAFSLDGQRQLVLVRRDNVEHLVMIGGPTDVVVESQIIRVQPQPQPAPAKVAPVAPAAPVAPVVVARAAPPPGPVAVPSAPRAVEPKPPPPQP